MRRTCEVLTNQERDAVRHYATLQFNAVGNSTPTKEQMDALCEHIAASEARVGYALDVKSGKATYGSGDAHERRPVP